MAIVAIYPASGMTTEQYDETIKRLDDTGVSKPLYHVCFGDKENLQVVDVYESREAFDKHGETLIPILKDVGINLAEPEVLEVHNIMS